MVSRSLLLWDYKYFHNNANVSLAFSTLRFLSGVPRSKAIMSCYNRLNTEADMRLHLPSIKVDITNMESIIPLTNFFLEKLLFEKMCLFLKMN